MSVKYKLVSKKSKKKTTVKIGEISIENGSFAIIAGPCAIESLKQAQEIAECVKKAGCSIFRGGVFKPRTSPYLFQGLGIGGLDILKTVSNQVKIPTVTEIVEISDIALAMSKTDAFQVGSRNMQNFSLLKELGLTKMPIILKRGMSARVEELFLAAEYILSKGNDKVILCERGIRTFENCTRNTLDLSAVPYMKAKTHLPIIVDPSHGTGIRSLVIPMAKAALVCGADGIMVEVHCAPKTALSDGKQSLYPHQIQKLVKELGLLAKAINKKLI